METELCHNCLKTMYPEGDGWKCSACGVCKNANGRYYMPAPPPLTNADRIRAMSDEELAEEIMCPYGMEEGMCTKPSDCLSCCLEWLRQPVQPTLDAPDAHEHSGLLEE